MNLEELRARLAELQETATAIQAKADAEKRALTEDESKELDGVFAEFDQTEVEIKRRERIAAQGDKLAASSRKTTGNDLRNQAEDRDGVVTGKDIRAARSTPAERGRWGWQSVGDFCVAVRNASDPSGKVDDRLTNAATTYGSEGVGADGGFAVPPEFRTEILKKVVGEDSLLARCDQVPTSSNSVTFPKDETAPWGTAGIQAFWDGEASVYTQKKPALETSTIKVNKLTALVPVTDELLEDAPALSRYVQNKASDVIDFKVTDAIVNGNGAGMPLGILASSCLVTQAAEASQVATTIHGLNLINMWARMPARWRSTAAWLCHPDVEPWLMKAGLQVGPAAAGAATGGTLIYMPPNGISGAPFGSLMGRPIIPTQACQTIGAVGDIIFAAMPQYAAILKAGGLRSDSSIHLWFDSGQVAFRFTLRLGGQPWWSSTIAAKNGSTTYGPFVALAAR